MRILKLVFILCFLNDLFDALEKSILNTQKCYFCYFLANIKINLILNAKWTNKSYKPSWKELPPINKECLSFSFFHSLEQLIMMALRLAKHITILHDDIKIKLRLFDQDLIHSTRKSLFTKNNVHKGIYFRSVKSFN